MISDEELENRIFKKLQFLSQTDEECAQLEVDTLTAKKALEAILDARFLVEDGTVDERKSKARQSKEYQDADKYYLACELAWKKVKYQRSTADIAVSAIQSVMRNRNQGRVT